MTDYFTLLIFIPDTGWTLLALFRNQEGCEAVAKLVRWAWEVRVACAPQTGA